MDLYVNPKATQRIYVRDLGLPQFTDSDDWFEVYERMPHKVRKAVEQAGLRARMFWRRRADGRLDDTDTSAELDLGAGKRALLYHSLVAWSFQRHGTIAVINEAALDMLDDALVEAMKDVVEAHYNASDRTEDEKKSPAPEGARKARRLVSGGVGGSVDGESTV